jgi:hypothetical protein
LDKQLTIENLPDPKEAIDILAKSGYLKIETEDLEISLKNHKTINLQPKDTIFGLEVSHDSAKVTFDTKKLREPSEPINTKEILDSALEEYYKESS